MSATIGGMTRRAFPSAEIVAAVALLIACAAPSTAARPSPQAIAGPEGVKPDGLVARVHDTLSKSVTNTAVWLDAFFLTERMEQEANETHILLRTDTLWRKGNNIRQQADGLFRVVLPTLQDRLQLLVTSSEDGQLLDDEEAGAASTLSDEDGANETNLVLQYLAKLSRRRDIRFETGARLQGATPVMFTGARYRYVFFEQAPWSARFTEQARWYTDSGWESRARLTLDRQLTTDLLTRFEVTNDWYQFREGFFYQAGPILFQSLSEKRVIRYEAMTNWQTQPRKRLERGHLRVRYRQQIWREWVFMELAPEVTFPRSRDYDPTPGFLLRFDAYFSERHT
ncbi:MAG TPA: hypothetical protein VJ985_07470 [Gammaproteobacteria bacterium]|nr:hypothetical protein [Gammaproteobacteria bacterium]